MFNKLKISKTEEKPTMAQAMDNEIVMEEGLSIENPQKNQNQIADYSEESLTKEEVDHFDELLGNEPMEQAENAVQSGDLIDEETFHQMFCMAFDITHGVTKLNSLNIPEQDDKFVACTRVIYKRILKMPMFHFMLRPGGELIGDLRIGRASKFKNIKTCSI